MYAIFERFIKPFPPEEPTQPPKTLFAFCMHYTRGSELYLVLLAFLTGAIAVMEVSLFSFLGDLVDWLATYSREDFLQQAKYELVSMSLVVLVALPTAVFFHSMLIHQTFLGNYPMSIRWLAHRFLLGQSYSFYQDDFAGRIATKVMQTSLAVREAVMKLLDVLLYVLVYFSSVVLVVAVVDLRLALPLLVWIIIYIFMLRYFLPRLGKIATQQADARSEMTGRIVDTYTNIATVKLFSHSRRESEYAKEGMDKFLKTVYPQMRLATSLSVCLWGLNALLIFSVTGLAIWLWVDSAISAGAIATAIGLVLRLYGMSQWIMWEISSLFENLGTTRDGMSTLSVKQEITDKQGAAKLQVSSGSIKFDRVDFHYGKGSGVLDGFELNIRAGEKVGIVGRSGAGKSTLLNLLLRFYDVESGAILIDGQDVKEVTQDSLRAQIGMVTQDTSLLHRSVRDNILYGRPEASDEAMILAAQKAHAHDFILDLEDNKGRKSYEAHVGERGVKLSGGQRQRIAIARVLLKNAPILILDEATSALDSEVEAAIQENLKELMSGKTVIAIAHRLSTIAALDRLIVLDKGRIVEQGSHAELLDLKGVYAQLWQRQSGGFLGE